VIRCSFLIVLDAQGESVTTLSSCICLGYEAVFECIVTGSGITKWSGTAFDNCSNHRSIALRHSEFIQSEYNISQNCSDSGLIIGRAVSVVNDSYTSQLTINVSQYLVGANVKCARQSDGESPVSKYYTLWCNMSHVYRYKLCFLIKTFC
jgi:hypothetical protein